LQEAGFGVYANDHRGHGCTAASPERFGDFGKRGFDLLVEDMVQLTHIAKQENPHKPFILFGHSMGSFAAQQYILDRSHSIDAIVLSGSGILDALAKLANSAAAQKYNFLNARFEPARTPFDWLSRDARVVDAFMNDPLCFPTLQPKSTESLFAPLSSATAKQACALSPMISTKVDGTKCSMSSTVARFERTSWFGSPALCGINLTTVRSNGLDRQHK